MTENIITYRQCDGYILVQQTQGPDLGYSPDSGVRIIVRDGFAFKSFDGSDTLLPYEDWRLDANVRAADLAGRLSRREIAGLMLYSPQNRLPMVNDTYGGKPFAGSGAKAWHLSDGQKKYLKDDNLRHLLVFNIDSPESAARWNNAVQAYVEGLGHGIPANNSSDPRHSAFEDAEFAPGSGGQLSLWSNLMGLASTFDPAVVREFADIASAEYRALGLATALSPQADLGTDPRWYRYNATFGNDPALVTDLIRAYCDGFQGSPDRGGDWGPLSVNAMVKHWPGGGSGEGGRDAHYGNGKYAVYPGGCYEVHKLPFTQGAFRLDGPTACASAVMPYYTVSYGQTDQAVGNSYNKEIITGQLRGQAGFDGVICTDWAITHDQITPGRHSGKPWGVETLTEAQRHFRALLAGVDQYGGNNLAGPVLEAFAMADSAFGHDWTDRRIRESARRLLLNSFRPGLFENPYVDVQNTIRTVGNPDWMARGYAQQLKSVVMLKNHNGLLPLARGCKVYVPQRTAPAMINYWGTEMPARTYSPVTGSMASKFYVAADAADADVAIVFIESPHSIGMGYDNDEAESGRGNGYVPVSLQYRPYTATHAREHSLAGDPAEPFVDRTYRGKSTRTWNECDLDLVLDTRRAMGNKPVIVVMAMSNPAVVSEFEGVADAILVGFSVQTQAFLDLIFGNAEPSGLLPFEIPASMDAIERHNEDQPHDIEPHRDADGNIYAFAFGLDFTGPVSDSRTARYRL